MSNKKDSALRPLNMRQRQFVDNIVYNAMERNEAYAAAYNRELNEDTKDKIAASASRLINLPHVYNYYRAIMDEMNDSQTEKVLWSRSIATEKLVRLIERAEDDLYEEDENGMTRNLTMARLNAIVLSAKELNLMYGLNETNINVEGQLVQIVGEADIPD